MLPLGSEPGKQQKEDGFGSRFQQHDGVHIVEKSLTKCRLQTRGVHSSKEKGGRERLEKLVSNRFALCVLKGHLYPSLYRLRRGATSLNFPCGTNPKGRGCAMNKGGGPLYGAMAHGGGLPLPLMGPMRPICLLIPFNYILIFNSDN